MTGVGVTLWTARAAAGCYAVAVVLLASRAADWRVVRRWWCAGALVFLAHVAAAFSFVHGWSHDDAFASTARQTADLIGIPTGIGLYLNYLFAVVWLADAGWWLLAPAAYARRPRAAAVAVHAFMGFMMFNATVVFGRWPFAAVYAVAMVAGLAVWVRARRPAR